MAGTVEKLAEERVFQQPASKRLSLAAQRRSSDVGQMTELRDWSPERIPDLSGKRIVVTGANSGIGLEAAAMFARKGAHVVLACRSTTKGQAAIERIVREHANASVELAELDLSSLASIRRFAETLGKRHASIDALCNNAGVMAVPYAKTADGFEMQLGTNHLGHFALTGLLLEHLLAAPAARIVTVSSGLHRRGKMRFDDLMGERRYRKWQAYAQSKLANLLFTFELDRRLRAKNHPIASVACHPGAAATNLQYVGPQLEGSRTWLALMSAWNAVLAQSAHAGALPTVAAATAPEVEGGDYVGPRWLFESRGEPVKVRASRLACDEQAAQRLWSVSEELTSVSYAPLA